jgi:hypothetical protein
MVKNSNVMRTYTLPSSHTVFLHLPGVLAAVILREAESADTSTALAQAGKIAVRQKKIKSGNHIQIM